MKIVPLTVADLLVKVALAVISGLMIAQMIWHSTRDGAAGSVPASAAFPEAPAAPPPNLQRLKALGLFGVYVPEQTGPAASAAPLDLVLLAVRVAVPARDSSATLSVSGGPATLFRQGDTIGGAARLEKVEPRSVVIAIGGELRTVYFPVTTSAPGLQGVYAETAAQFGATAEPSAAEADQVIDSIRTEIAANPQRLLARYNISATAAGYEIGAAPPDVLLRAGVKPGDRVIRVNGATVGEIERDRAAFEAVIASGRVRVDLLRDGQPLTLTFPLK